MKTFAKAVAIFVLFFMGTTAVVHVDRQCARINGAEAKITIEKYASLH